jgi:hypothetical protein
MDPRAWLEQAEQELRSLQSEGVHEPDDAWRAVSLIARLLGNPTGPAPAPEALGELARWLALAGQPDPAELLGRLSASLDGEEDPFGPLLDVLLDLDDALGVMAMHHELRVAQELAVRAAAMVGLWPERVQALEAFAIMRQATLRNDAPANTLWVAVMDAPAHLLAAALPVDAKGRFPPSSLLRARPRPPTTLVLPTRELRAAAWSAGEGRSVEFSAEGVDCWVYTEEGRRRMELRFADEDLPVQLWLDLVRRADDERLASIRLDIQRSGRTLYADLGPEAGPENLVHKLLAQSGLTADQGELRLRIDHGE